MQLHHDRVGEAQGSPLQSAVFLHGILGSGPNLRSLARSVSEARPDIISALMDLRAHGRSLGQEGDDTLSGAAQDVVQTAATLPAPARSVLGHSFGGKVALTMLLEHPGQIGDVFVVDSTPGARPDRRGAEGTMRVLDMLDEIGDARFASRSDFIRDVQGRGQPVMLAQWLAQSLVRETDQSFRFGLDLARIRALLDDYFLRDLWPVAESPPGDARVHFVVGGRSTSFDDADRKRAASLAAGSAGRVTVTTLDTDHWVHIQDPTGLLRVVLDRLGERGP